MSESTLVVVPSLIDPSPQIKSNVAPLIQQTRNSEPTIVFNREEVGIILPTNKRIPGLPELKSGQEVYYVPVTLAKQRIVDISNELISMKKRHLEAIDTIQKSYHELNQTNMKVFQDNIDKVKVRAAKTINEHKQTIETLTAEKVALAAGIASLELDKTKLSNQYNNTSNAQSDTQARLEQNDQERMQLGQQLGRSSTGVAGSSMRYDGDNMASGIGAGVLGGAIVGGAIVGGAMGGADPQKLRRQISNSEEELAQINSSLANLGVSIPESEQYLRTAKISSKQRAERHYADLEKWGLLKIRGQDISLQDYEKLNELLKYYESNVSRRTSLKDSEKNHEEMRSEKAKLIEEIASLDSIAASLPTIEQIRLNDAKIRVLELNSLLQDNKSLHSTLKEDFVDTEKARKEIISQYNLERNGKIGIEERGELSKIVTDHNYILVLRKQELEGLLEQLQTQLKAPPPVDLSLYNDKIARLDSRNKELKDQLLAKEAERMVLLSKINEFDVQKMSLKADIDAKSSEKEMLQNQMMAKDVESATIRRQIEELTAATDPEARDFILKKQIEEYRKESQDKTLEIQALQASVLEIQAQSKQASVAALAELLKAKEDAMAQAKLEAAASSSSASSEEVETLRSQLAFAERELVTLRSGGGGIGGGGELGTMQQQLVSIEGDAKAHESKFSKGKEFDLAIAALEKEKNTLQKDNDDLQLQVSKMKVSFEKSDGLQKAKDELTVQVTNLVAAAKEQKELVDAQEEQLRIEVARRKEFQFKYEEAKGKVRVYARCRPFNKYEKEAGEEKAVRKGKNDWTIELMQKKTDVTGRETIEWRPFGFDAIFMPESKGKQEEIFEECKTFGEMAVQGVNTCIFAYGQSGTGKTFTMAGYKPDLAGLKPRMIDYIFDMCKATKANKDFRYKVSSYMVEIYLNKLEDLYWKLETKQKNEGKKKSEWPDPEELKVRFDGKKRVQIQGVKIKEFTDAPSMHSFTDEAEHMRRVRKTGLNDESSRSHLIFAIIIEAQNLVEGKTTVGKLSLCDLAGSERANKTNVVGLSDKDREAMLEEGVAINESLQMLKNVFRVLGQASAPSKDKKDQKELVQFRGNMLTELMQDSLGGNARTLMFVNVGPAYSNTTESMDSLSYGDFVKNITNEVATEDQDYVAQIQFLKLEMEKYKNKFGAI